MQVGSDAAFFASRNIGAGVGTGGQDLVEGHDGADALIGGADSDSLVGDAQQDDFSLINATGDDVLLGDNGLIDWAFSTGNPGADDFDMSAGDGLQSTIDLVANTITAVGAADVILGNDGSDIAIGGAGGDVILGDIRANIGAALTVNTRTAATAGGGDILVGDGGSLSQTGGDPVFLTAIETGIGGDDLIEGHDLGDIIIGGFGADQIQGDFSATDSGLAGVGSGGADVILGDSGLVDWAFDPANPDPDQFNATSGDNDQATVDRVLSLDEGTGGNDIILASDFADIAFGGAADDIVLGDLRADFDGNTITGRQAADTGGADILLGDSGELQQANGSAIFLTSTAAGIGGADLIEGHDLADILIGGFGSDIVHGEAASADIGLISAAGDDVAFGDNGLVDWIGGDGDQSDFDLISSVAPAIGDVDIVLGNDGRDILIGGQAGDQLYGDRTADVGSDLTVSNEQTGGTVGIVDTDIILGDNGLVDFVIAGDSISGRPDLDALDGLADGTFNAVFANETVLVTSTDTNEGGADLIIGDGAADLIIGGTAGDRIWGDDADLGDSATDGDDLIFGDHGKVWLTPGITRASPFGDDYFAIDTGAGDGGAGDLIFGEAGDDIALGQQGDDVIFGGIGQDDLIGGHNVEGGADDLDGLNQAQIDAIIGTLAQHDPTDLQEVNDIIDGDRGEDVIAGDNAIINRENVATNPRFRALDGTELYSMVTADVPIPGLEGTNFTVDLGFTPNVGDALADPSAILPRSVFLLDFDAQTELAAANNPNDARPFGDDLIAGGQQDDEIFGQLGDDIIEGDGDIRIELFEPVGNPGETQQTFVIPDGFAPNQDPLEIAPQPVAGSLDSELVFSVFSTAEDGDDYVEGNGGNDLILGNLGQDDLIGGSSSLFAIFGAGAGADLRPDGADLIFGDSGDADWLARNADHTTAGDANVDDDNFHVADADFIAGDNANIFRLDGLAFAYATGAGYGAAGNTGLDRDLEIRVIELLDYSYAIDGSGINPETGTVDWKTSFSNEGVGLGDLIHGESGDDVIHGMTGDDLIFGEAGDDDIYGQAGADVILGGTGEDGIMGDDGLLSTSRNGTAEALYGVAATTQEVIRTPGNLQLALINRTGELNKSADMIAFDLDGARDTDMTSANDIIFGGLGDDWIHSGDGSDAVSGAEALAAYYNMEDLGGGFTVNDFLKAQQLAGGLTPLAEDPFWIGFGLYNPGNILQFGATDPEEFALYDENDPRSKIAFDLDAMGIGGTGILDFLLNWDATEGPLDDTFTMTLNTDGQDNIFGDLGADWIVGGTGRDHMFGGRGNDLINMDDDLDTNGGANTDPDAFQEYADIVYDGAGRDVMILNTGADRAIAWVGEYNSYLTPFSPFGAFHISRTLQPQTEAFVIDLARASGADIADPGDLSALTESLPDILRFAEQFAIDDKLDNPLDEQIFFEASNGPGGRFGSPFGELGMVRQEDFDWQDQTGSPDDPQAGNDKGKREIMRRELWMPEDTNGAQAAALENQAIAEQQQVIDSFNEVYGENVITIEETGILTVSDSVTLIADFTNQSVTQIEVDTIIEAEKATKGLKSNAYIVFDYVTGSDFKFAGVDVSRNKVQIGYRSGDAWIIVAEVNAQLKPDTPYDLNALIVGDTVTISVDGAEMASFTFDESLLDGQVGVATNDGEATFTQTTITAQGDDNVTYTTTDEEQAAATTGGSGDGSVDWGDTVVDDGTSDGGAASADSGASDTGTPDGGSAGGDTGTATTDPAASSDTATGEEEQVTVSAWVPRSDFDTAA